MIPRVGPKPIEVMVDKPRHLLINMAGLIGAQEYLNKTRHYDPPRAIFRIIVDESQSPADMGMDFCAAILWAGLVHEDPELLIEDAIKLPWIVRDINVLAINLIHETYLNIEQQETEIETGIESDEKKNLTRLNGTLNSGRSPESILG